MVYIAIDDSSKEGKALIGYLTLQKFTHIYKEPSRSTKKAIDEAKNGKTFKAKDVNDLFK